MTKLPHIGFTALIAAAGLAAPALAATPKAQVSNAPPFCSSNDVTEFDSRMDALSTQLQLSTKPNATIEESGGCLKVTTVADGKVTMSYYDPDSFKLLAQIG